jgi:arylsulfatase A-like enzyme
MTLFTSVPPDIHRRNNHTLPHAEGITTLAELLQKAGYQTIAITANPMTNRRYGFAKGFEHYDDYTVALAPEASIGQSAQAATSPTLNRLAEGWLTQRDPDRPLFLFVLYLDPHWDYQPPAMYYQMFTDDPIPPLKETWSWGSKTITPVERERILAAYDGEIRYTDTHVGNLLKKIENSPRGKNTAIAICADHGEGFWERGKTGHANNLHEEEIHVPLIIRAPKSTGLAEGVVIDEQVGLIDLPPTFLDFAGVPIPEAWYGKSLLPFFTGGTVPERPLVMGINDWGVVMRGVRTSRYKMMAHLPFETPFALYDLKADPKEQNNLVKDGAQLPYELAALIPLLKTSIAK